MLYPMANAQNSISNHRDSLLSGGVYVNNLGKWVMLGIEYHQIPVYEKARVYVDKKWKVL